MEATHIITFKNLRGLGVTETTNHNRNYDLLVSPDNPIKVKFLGVNPRARRVSWISICDPKDFDRLSNRFEKSVIQIDRKVNKFAVYTYQLTKIL